MATDFGVIPSLPTFGGIGNLFGGPADEFNFAGPPGDGGVGSVLGPGVGSLTGSLLGGGPNSLVNIGGIDPLNRAFDGVGRLIGGAPVSDRLGADAPGLPRAPLPHRPNYVPPVGTGPRVPTPTMADIMFRQSGLGRGAIRGMMGDPVKTAQGMIDAINQKYVGNKMFARMDPLSLGKIIYGEAGGKGMLGMMSVANTMLNRSGLQSGTDKAKYLGYWGEPGEGNKYGNMVSAFNALKDPKNKAANNLTLDSPQFRQAMQAFATVLNNPKAMPHNIRNDTHYMTKQMFESKNRPSYANKGKWNLFKGHYFGSPDFSESQTAKNRMLPYFGGPR